jgi:hypothetical protein
MTHITEDRMWSDVSPATAAFRPDAAADGGGAWVVSWLTSRLLTRSQAVTAMTLAETAARGVDSRMWPHIRGWAAELGLVMDEALALLASLPPEESDDG